MSLARRPASELPGDPARLRLVYSHGHPAVPYEDEDTLENWHVSIRAYHDEEEECAGGCTDACRQLIDNGSEAGWLRLWRLRDYTGADRWMVADAQSGDLESIAATVLDDGEYSGAFQEAIDCPVGDLLILDRVFLARPWRGFGLGPVFAAEAIRRLSGGCCAVAAEPGMAEWPENRDELSDADRATANAKIAALWESIGFHAFHSGVQLLDTSLQEPIDLHRAHRKHLEDLSAAYRAHLEGRPALPEPATTPPAPPQWHPTRNAALLPTHVTPHSRRVVWWLCPEGHTTEDSVADRTKGLVCQQCPNSRRRRAVPATP
ncbi:zinc-ribbon domain-containing protein [Streptomyces chartreusis]|uniref:zinc-ribbon domain-containing protein n=1 Tax=Streptomyces chartreusis TaxID=1969 RepID=UPI00381CEEB6